jgi:DNA-binding CsgD family transcriptional regulator
MVRLPVPRMKQALEFMLEIAAIGRAEDVVRTVVERLPRLVPSELTTLSICDLPAGTRRVVALPGESIAPDAQAVFNRLMREHPLVRFHSTHPGGGSRRISDGEDASRFRSSELHADYYRRIGIDHVVAVPVSAGPGLVMSYVLNRRGRDFDDREIALLDALRPALANLGRFASWTARGDAGTAALARLTPREAQVLRWVAAGRGDKEVAAILGMSVRTVHKHLANIYPKLGVANRTAAASLLSPRDLTP